MAVSRQLADWRVSMATATYPSEQGKESPATPFQTFRGIMSTAITTSTDTGQHTTSRSTTQPTKGYGGGGEGVSPTRDRP